MLNPRSIPGFSHNCWTHPANIFVECFSSKDIFPHSNHFPDQMFLDGIPSPDTPPDDVRQASGAPDLIVTPPSSEMSQTSSADPFFLTPSTSNSSSSPSPSIYATTRPRSWTEFPPQKYSIRIELFLRCYRRRPNSAASFSSSVSSLTSDGAGEFSIN